MAISEDQPRGTSIITMLEKDEDNILKTLWDADNDMEPRNEDGDNNSEEEIHTYRISNPWTPIEDVNAIPSEIDASFLSHDDNKKHILNNLLYGNFKKNIEENKSRKEIFPNTWNKSIESTKTAKPTKLCKLRIYNYAQKLASASSIKQKQNSSYGPDWITQIDIRRSRLNGSLENPQMYSTETPLIVSTTKAQK